MVAEEIILISYFYFILFLIFKQILVLLLHI